MTEDENNLQNLASDWAILIYKMISAAHSFAYFGFITIQPLIINEILKRILPESEDFFSKKYSLQISILIISLRLIFQVVLETPSGAFADNHGRMITVRNSFLFRFLSMVFFMGAFCLASLSNGGAGLSQIGIIIIIALIFAEIFMAIGDALFSGSMDAWLVDTVTHCGNLQLHKQNSIGDKISETFSSSAMQQNIAIMISMPFFLLLYLYISKERGGHIYSTTAIVAVVFLGACVLAHGARREIYRHTVEWSERSTVSIWHTLKQSWELIRSTKTLFWWIILMASPFGAWVIVSWTWPILLQNIISNDSSLKDSPQSSNFILIAFSMIVALARVGGAWFCHSLQRNFNPYRGLRMALILNLIILSLGAVFLWQMPRDESSKEFTVPAGVAIFLLSLVAAKALEEIVKIFTKVVLSRVITNSTVRATAISFQSLVASLFPFFFILLSVYMSFDRAAETPVTKTDGGIGGVGIIVLVSSMSGLILAVIASIKLYKPMSLSRSEDIIHEDAGGFND